VQFEAIETVWSTVFLIILVSIVLHGVSVTPVMKWIDRRRGVDPARRIGVMPAMGRNSLERGEGSGCV
jgi:NhaP-type Na+/H+ or K+/H+ antiporter